MEHGVAVLVLTGRLVFGRDAQGLEDFVRNSLKIGQKRFVFDATALEYVDSSGIGALVSSLNEITKAGGDLRVAGANSRLQRRFTTTGVDRLLVQCSSVAEATSR